MIRLISSAAVLALAFGLSGTAVAQVGEINPTGKEAGCTAKNDGGGIQWFLSGLATPGNSSHEAGTSLWQTGPNHLVSPGHGDDQNRGDIMKFTHKAGGVCPTGNTGQPD